MSGPVKTIAIPVVLGYAAFAAVIAPSIGSELTWTRLITGCAAWVTISFGGAILANWRQ